MANHPSVAKLPDSGEVITQTKAQSFSTNIVQDHPFLSFVIIAYTLAWSGNIAEATLHFSWFPTPLVDFVVNWAPGIAALVVVTLLEGKRGWRRLLHPLLRWRMSPGWYVLALGTAPVIILIAIGMGMIFGGPAPVFSQTLTPRLALLGILLFFNTGEEVGWRGFALPWLQARFAPLVASLILGFIWGIWHAPIYVLSGQSIALLVFVPSAMTQTFLMTWLYNRTGGNLLLMALFHWSWDTMLEMIVPAWLSQSGLVSTFVLATIICIVLALLVATRLNRQSLPPSSVELLHC